MGNGLYKLYVLVFLLLVAAVFTPVFAQHYKYRHITPDDGLPSSTIYRIIQDSKGFIWIATDAGVCRYDGNKFQTFTVKDGLPDNEVLNLYEDKEGRIWFYVFKKEPAYFYHGSIIKFNPENFFDGTLVHSIVQDKLGYYWFATSTKGILKYKDGKCSYFNKQTGLPNNYIMLTKGWKDQVWLSTFQQYSADDMASRPYMNSSHLYGLVDGKPIFPLHVFPDSVVGTRDISVALATSDQSLYCHSKTHLVRLRGDSMKVVLSREIVGRDINLLKVNEDKHGNLLVAGSPGGAFRITLENPAKREEFLPHLATNDIMEDKENNLWITTLNDGIYFLSQSGQQVLNYYDTTMENKTSLTGIVADSINHHLYFSTIGGDIYTLQVNRLRNFHTDSKVRFNSLGSSVTDSSGNTWCLSTSNIYILKKGLLAPITRHDGVTYDFIGTEQIGKDVKYEKSFSFIQFGGAKSLCLGSHNEIWGCGFCGVFRITQNHPKYYILKQFHNARSAGICYDKNGRVWFGTVKGLCYLDHDTMACIDKKTLTIPETITDIVVDYNNVLWIATAGAGIYSFRDKVLDHVTSSSGLSNDEVNKITLYNGFLLVATKKGINKIEIDKQSKVTAVFPLQINNGLASKEVNDLYLEEGRVYAVTNAGLSVFDEKSISRDTTAPMVYITRVKINDRDTLLNSKLELPYNLNNIKMEYVGISFKSGKDILYRYKMEGVDTAWMETPYINTQYPTLPPGKYKFNVDARSLHGQWSNRPASIVFIIYPPFWQTWWFRILAAILFVAIVSAVAYGVFNYYRNKNEVTKKLVQLEGQALRAQMNPHFIFNSLNAIHDFIADHDQRSAHLYLSRFAALIRRTLDLSRKPTVNLAEELETLKLYLELEIMRFKGKIEYEFSINTIDDPSELLLPAMLLQPYLENALRHGLMNKEGKGKLVLDIAQDGDLLKCRITDNGIGRKAASQRGQNISAHRSHAMDITGERLNIFNEKGQPIKAEVRIIDLTDKEGNALGTQVDLTIPLNQT